MPPARLAALLLLAASPAAARCPATPADAAAGLSVVYDDGSTSRLTLTAEGLTREENAYNDGSGLGELLIGRHGYLVTQLWPMQDGIQMTGALYLRDHPAAELAAPPLAPGETRSWTATTRDETGSVEDSLTFAAGPEETRRIGDCTFRASTVTVTLDNPSLPYPETETWLYLPDLGLSVFLSVTGPLGPALTLQPVSLQAAGPP